MVEAGRRAEGEEVELTVMDWFGGKDEAFLDERRAVAMAAPPLALRAATIARVDLDMVIEDIIREV